MDYSYTSSVLHEAGYPGLAPYSTVSLPDLFYFSPPDVEMTPDTVSYEDTGEYQGYEGYQALQYLDGPIDYEIPPEVLVPEAPVPWLYNYACSSPPMPTFRLVLSKSSPDGATWRYKTISIGGDGLNSSSDSSASLPTSAVTSTETEKTEDELDDKSSEMATDEEEMATDGELSPPPSPTPPVFAARPVRLVASSKPKPVPTPNLARKPKSPSKAKKPKPVTLPMSTEEFARDVAPAWVAAVMDNKEDTTTKKDMALIKTFKERYPTIKNRFNQMSIWTIRNGHAWSNLSGVRPVLPLYKTKSPTTSPKNRGDKNQKKTPLSPRVTRKVCRPGRPRGTRLLTTSPTGSNPLAVLRVAGYSARVTASSRRALEASQASAAVASVNSSRYDRLGDSSAT